MHSSLLPPVLLVLLSVPLCVLTVITLVLRLIWNRMLLLCLKSRCQVLSNSKT